jgi:hypothetical protein
MSLRGLLSGFALILAACASSGGGGSALYRRDVGNASGVDAVSRSLLILNRFQYEVFDQDNIPSIRIETHWKPRQPFADEKALGIQAAENRIVISANTRGQTNLGSLYNVRLVIENRVRTAGVEEWDEKTNTGMFRSYADGIAQALRTELSNIGVRRY